VNSIFLFSYFGPNYPTCGLTLTGLARVYCTQFAPPCNREPHYGLKWAPDLRLYSSCLLCSANMYGGHGCQSDVQVLRQSFRVRSESSFNYKSKLHFLSCILYRISEMKSRMVSIRSAPPGGSLLSQTALKLEYPEALGGSVGPYYSSRIGHGRFRENHNLKSSLHATSTVSPCL
jgi:hypothetical protein